MNYENIVSQEQVDAAVASLAKNNFKPQVVANRAEALELIKQIIPAGASVMNGASVTLQEIGFVDYLKAGVHDWNNLHQGILEEADPEKQALLRTHSVISDFYLGSVHAVDAGSGALVIASNTGSQLPHLAYTSPNLILVVGTNKITASMDEALKRLHEYVIPKEDARAQVAYGGPTYLGKTLILHGENPYMKRNVHVIFVNEALGY